MKTLITLLLCCLPVLAADRAVVLSTSTNHVIAPTDYGLRLLTNANAGELLTLIGAVNETNTAQLNASQTFTGTNTFSVAPILTAGINATAGKVSATDGFNAPGNIAFYIGGSTLVGYWQVAGRHFNAKGDGYFDGSYLKLGYNSGSSVSLFKSGNNILLSPAATGYVAVTNLVATNITASSVVIGGGAAVTGILSATATLNFDLSAVVVEDLTITVTGAGDGDTVSIGVPAGSVTTTAQYTGWVSATNTVTIRARTSVAGEDPASGTFRATVTKF